MTLILVSEPIFMKMSELVQAQNPVSGLIYGKCLQ